MLEKHPEIVPEIVNANRAYISNQVATFHKHTIAYGPFMGFKFDPMSSWGAADRGQ